MSIPKNEPIKGWMLVHCGQYIRPQRVPYTYVLLDNDTRFALDVNTCDQGCGSSLCLRCSEAVVKLIASHPIDQQLPAEIHLTHE